MRTQPDDWYTRAKHHIINWFVLITLLWAVIRLIAAEFGLHF